MGKFVSSVFLFVFLSVSLFADGVDQALLARLQSEGCAGLRAQEKYLNHIHLRFLQSTQDRKFEYDYYGNGKNFLLKMEIPSEMWEAKPDHFEYRMGKNELYFFEIHKKKTEEEWEIVECLDLKSFDIEETDLTDVFDTFPCYLFRSSLADLIGKPGFEITRIESVPDQPEETVSFDFEITKDNVVEALGELKTGTVQLLPERSWAAKEITLNCNRGGNQFVTAFTFTYGEKSSELYQVTHSQVRLSRDYAKSDDPLKFITWDYEILAADHAKVPKKELFLKYYGLDEPKYASAANLIRSILLIAGVLVILFSVWRRFHKNRSCAPDPQ